MAKKVKVIIKKREKKKKGFTLVELLAVIVILAIIMIITISIILGNMKESKQIAFNTIGETMVKYIDDNYNNCKLGNSTIAKYDDSLFNPDCSLKDENKEELSKNLIINSGYKLEDIEKVEVIIIEEGKFGIVVHPNKNGKYNNLDKFTNSDQLLLKYDSSCWDIETINDGEYAGTYKLVKFNGLNEDGTINKNCNGYMSKGDDSYYSVKVPSDIEGKKITILGNNLFHIDQFDSENYYYYIKEILIEEGIKEIEDGYIYDDGRLFIFNYGAFSYTGNKVSLNVKLPSSLTKIGDYAFYNSNITKINIPVNVEIIGEEAFNENRNLNLLIFEEINNSKLEIIEEYAFSYCNLNFSENDALLIPSSVKSIGAGAFSGNKNIKKVMFLGADEGISELKTIGGFNNTSISEITIPESVTEIGAYAFSSTKISEITIPKNVIAIREGAFRSTEISEITIPEKLTKIENEVFEDTKISKIIIPEGVTEIGAFAFESTELSEITIPKSVETIGESAFGYNDKLNKVVFEVEEDGTSNLKTINRIAFSDCSLKHSIDNPLIIPKSVELIGDYAFYNNPGIYIKYSGDTSNFGKNWNGSSTLIK